MTKAKIAITVPEEILAQARRSVRKGAAPNLSAYISRAIEQKAQADDLTALLDEMLAETGGPLTAKEIRAADRALGITPKKKRRAK